MMLLICTLPEFTIFTETIMHLAPKFLHQHGFLLLLGITVVPIFFFFFGVGRGGGGNKVRYGLVENGQWSNYIFKRPSTEQQNSYFLHFTYFEQDAGKILSSFKPG